MANDARLLDPTDAAFVTGTEGDRKRARDEWHRARFVRQVMNSNLAEIPRSSIAMLKFGIVEDTTTGQLYRARRDGLIDLSYVDTAVAYYCAPDGTPILLERPAGAQTRQELEQRQAAREQQRNAPKPRPAWMR